MNLLTTLQAKYSMEGRGETERRGGREAGEKWTEIVGEIVMVCGQRVCHRCHQVDKNKERYTMEMQILPVDVCVIVDKNCFEQKQIFKRKLFFCVNSCTCI